MQQKKLNQLQFLRFIAFSFIYLYHALGTNLEPYFYSANSAYAMVSFFFILSGFGSAYSSSDNQKKPTLIAILHHEWKKIKKIYPILFLSIIFCILQTNLPNAINTLDIALLKSDGIALLKCLLMIQAWWNPFLYYNGVTWFISAIMFLYLFDLPIRYLLDKLHKKKNEKKILFGLSITFLIIILFTSLLVKDRTDIGYYLYAFPPARLAEYLLGMCTGRLLYRVSTIHTQKNKTHYLRYTILEAFSLFLWVSEFFFAFPNNSFIIQVYWILPNLFVLFIFGMGKGAFSKLFCLGPFQSVGNISMECYLLHQPLLMTYNAFIHIENTVSGTLFYIIFNFLFTIMLSILLHKKTQ